MQVGGTHCRSPELVLGGDIDNPRLAPSLTLSSSSDLLCAPIQRAEGTASAMLGGEKEPEMARSSFPRYLRMHV